MKNKRLLSPKEASSALGISVRTLYRWEEAGNLSTVRTVGNQRRIPIEEIARLRRRGKGQSGAERCVLYARVSSVRQEQDGNLARQTERLKEAATARGYEVGAVISEQASSLNENRKGMKKLLTLIGEQAVDVILIEYPARLVRFGFGYLEETFRWQGVRLEVLDPPKQLEATEELGQDLLTIVTVFVGRLYGHRARGIRKRVQTALKECEEIPVEGTHGTGEPDDQTAP
jgi:excisionase family DNA binding protein